MQEKVLNIKKNGLAMLLLILLLYAAGIGILVAGGVMADEGVLMPLVPGQLHAGIDGVGSMKLLNNLPGFIL